MQIHKISNLKELHEVKSQLDAKEKRLKAGIKLHTQNVINSTSKQFNDQIGQSRKILEMGQLGLAAFQLLKPFFNQVSSNTAQQEESTSQDPYKKLLMNLTEVVYHQLNK